MERDTTFLMVAGSISTLLGLGVSIALLVVTLTVVRRHKPQAVVPLAASFGIGIVSTLSSVVVYPLLATVTHSSSDGIGSYMVMQSAVTVGFALVHMVAGVLLVLGLVKVATPT
jgi:hypothetical protein